MRRCLGEEARSNAAAAADSGFSDERGGRERCKQVACRHERSGAVAAAAATAASAQRVPPASATPAGQPSHVPPTPSPPSLSAAAAAACGCDDSWSWSKRDKSHEVRLYGARGETAHFHPNWSNGTAGVRGTRVLNGGVYYWEVRVAQRVFGTSMMFGVGTRRARLHVDAFVNLLGEDEQSCGLSHKGVFWQRGKGRQFAAPFKENEPTTVALLFHGPNGTLTYFKDGVCLGVAATGLDAYEDDLYPIVCSTAAKTEMTLGTCRRCFFSLQDRCRAVIAGAVSVDDEVDELPLPKRLRTYVKEAVENNPPPPH